MRIKSTNVEGLRKEIKMAIEFKLSAGYSTVLIGIDSCLPLNYPRRQH